MSNWISVKDRLPSVEIVDIWVEVKPSGYHGRIIDCYLESGVWKDRDGEIDSIFQGAVEFWMIRPRGPNE